MKKRIKLLTLSLLGLLTCYSQSTLALTIAPVPHEPIYFEPPVVLPTDEQQKWNCTALDNAIRYLHPYRYTYKPAFSEDGSNKLAVALMTIDDFPLADGGLAGLAYLAYSSLVEEREQRRVLSVEEKIIMFQRLKAEKHCFE